MSMQSAQHITDLLLEGFTFEAAVKVHYGHLKPAIQVDGRVYSAKNRTDDHYSVFRSLPAQVVDRIEKGSASGLDDGYYDEKCKKFHSRRTLGNLQHHDLMKGH